MLILLNVLIAMMADTYSLMTSQRKGLYNYGIIRAVPAYKVSKHYGGLLIDVFPFSVIGFLLLPLYAMIKDKTRLIQLTKTVYMLLYTVVALMLSVYYLIANLLMMPFAYLKTCGHKISLLTKKRIGLANCLLYILIGLPLLIVAQATDLYTFLLVSFSTRKRYQSDDIFVITTAQFDEVHQILLEANEKWENVQVIDVVLLIRKAFYVEHNITVTLYGNDMQPPKGADSNSIENKLVGVDTA